MLPLPKRTPTCEPMVATSKSESDDEDMDATSGPEPSDVDAADTRRGGSRWLGEAKRDVPEATGEERLGTKPNRGEESVGNTGATVVVFTTSTGESLRVSSAALELSGVDTDRVKGLGDDARTSCASSSTEGTGLANSAGDIGAETLPELLRLGRR